jgi:nucleoside-diphosphate-sugar epimerase
VGEIYHSAAALGFRPGGDAEIFETNVEGTRRLLGAARESGVSRLVYTSSVAVYGDHLTWGITEGAPVNPSAAYGVSKVRAESLLRDAATTGLPCMIVRPCIIYGPGDRYFLPQSAWAVRLPVLPLPDGGRHVVDVVHADDVAAAHLLVMETGQPGETYNVTDGECHQVGDLLRWIAEALDRAPRFLPLSLWAAHCCAPLVRAAGLLGRIPELAHLRQRDVAVFFGDYHFDISKIASLGFTPHIHAHAGIRSVLRERP